MYNNKYVGNRYTPIIDGEHNNTKAYDSLVIVTYQGNSYTSKKKVPIGVDITNKTYWECTGNYNAQIEQYRQDVFGYGQQLDDYNLKVEDITKIKTSLTDLTGESIKIKGLFTAINNGDITTTNPIVAKCKYFILIENVNDKTIDFSGDSVISLDTSTGQNPNVIVLNNCKNVKIKNMKVYGINQDLITERDLTNGNSIYMNNCYNCSVENSYFYNTVGGVYILNSDNCFAKNCVHEVSDEMQQKITIKKTNSSFVLCQCKNSFITDCVSYGSMGDSNFFLNGGTGQNNCYMVNCKAYGYDRKDLNKTIVFVEGQAFAVDGSNNSCKISDCYAYGFAYGIDVKNYSNGTMVVNNIIKNSQVGICVRPGDQGLNNPDTFSCMIESNQINPNGGNGIVINLPSYSTLTQESVPIGIMVHDGYGVKISNNVIENDTNVGRKDFIHVGVYMEKNYATDKNQQGIIISDNRLSAMNTKYNQTGSSVKHMIVVKGKNVSGNLTIENNHFTPFFDNSIDIENVIFIATTSYIVNVIGNKFTRIKGSVAIDIDCCILLNFNNNQFDLHSGILKVGSLVTYCNVTNNISWQQSSNVNNKIYELLSNGDIIFNDNKYYGRSGVENNFLTISSSTCRAIVQNNIIMGGYVLTGNMLSISTSNKIVTNNNGATGSSSTLTTITG